MTHRIFSLLYGPLHLQNVDPIRDWGGVCVWLKCSDSFYVVFLLQAYYRQGIALQCQERHAEALAAFASGLAQEPKSVQLLSGLVESAMKSPLRGKN